MKQRVHIHTIEVSGQGQIIHFQVRIPRDAKRITGILITENAPVDRIASVPSKGIVPPAVHSAPAMAVSPDASVGIFDIARPRILFPIMVGALILQARDRANIFYGEDILHSDNSYTVGDFTAVSFRAARAIEAPKKNLPGGAKWKELCIEIDVQNTKLFGIYKDNINEKTGADNPYQVKLYFLYEQK